MNVPSIALNDGNHIPQLGFGTWQVAPDRAADFVRTALSLGYRHIDTAEMYRNEKGVGEGIRASGLAREQIYVTSKLDNGFHEPDKARKAMQATLQALGIDFVDLFLIHWPLPTLYGGDFVSTWKTLIEFKKAGLARSVGVSNFQPAHLEKILAASELAPAVNQIEVHPHFNNEQVRQCDARHGIVTQAWSPLGQGKLLSDPAIVAMATKLGRTPAQVVLRWHIQRGDVIFPKSSSEARMRENLNIFDFQLSEQDMAALTGLDRGAAGRIGPDPDTFAWIP